MFIETIGDDEATGEIAEIYAEEKKALGFVMEGTRCWTARPDLLPMVDHLLNTARASFSLGLRGWRLITLIAAKHIPSTYCSHVYARSLVKDLGSKERVLAVHRNFRNAGLSGKEVAMLAYARQVTIDASKTTQADIDALRAAGFSDVNIADIAFCAAFRCFMSRYFDATGAQPEPFFFDEDPEFREAMTVGKAI